MAIAVKDANQVVQNISTQNDAQTNLVPVHAPASTVAGISTPVGPSAPLPVINTAGAAALDGSGTITVGGTAQPMFGGIIPVNGFLVANNSAETLYVSDVGVAVVGGASIPIAAGVIFTTPTGYRVAGPVSIIGGTTAQPYAARRW